MLDITVPGSSRCVLGGAVVDMLQGAEAVMIARRTVGVHRWAHIDTELRPQRKAGSGMIPDGPKEFATTGKIVAPVGMGKTANFVTQDLLRLDKMMPQRQAGLAILSNGAVGDILRGAEAVMIARCTVGVRRWARADTEVRPQRKAD